MEYPTNFNTALEVEDIIRKEGAIPATIAIIKGIIKIGLTKEEIEYLSKNGRTAKKCSRRDIASILQKKLDGSTTVAATMYLANKAGLKIFVTGGIGGVHRGAETTFDISADLTELGQTPVAVVCAGAKSILDIGKTLEFLETQGVAVVGYKTDKFPEFFTSDSGFFVSNKIDNEKEGAELIKISFDELKLKNGIIVAVPIPKEQEADGIKIKEAVGKALQEAEKLNVKGAEITPFLLKRINEITEGESSKSSII